VTDPLVRLKVSNQLLEDVLKGTSGLMELLENHMKLALDGGADPKEVLERWSVDLRTERRHIANQIELIRSWRESNG
jgi:hypothetical protein